MTQSREILHRTFRGECRSLAQYVGESWPWTHRGDREAEELVQSIMADERRWADQIAAQTRQLGEIPRMGSYPMAFTTSNLHYLSLDYMLERLADYLDRVTDRLRGESVLAAGDAALHGLLEQMIERKTGQAAALRKLARQLQSAAPQPAAS